MGYKIETYSLDELNRISNPGKVVPALFWLVPLGQWNQFELEKLWDHFTIKDSKCRKLGLVLVKNSTQRIYETNLEQVSNLSNITAKLSELLPSGIKTIYNKEYLSLKESKNQVLILSGSYPQPGWGILTSIKNIHHFDNIIDKIIDHNEYSIFLNASNSFKKWSSLKKEKPIKEDTEILKWNKEYLIDLYKNLKNLLAEINYEQLYKLIQSIKKVKKENSCLEISDVINPIIEYTDDKFILAILILNTSKDIAIEELELRLDKFSNQLKSNANNLFKSEPNEKIKKTASQLLKLTTEDRPKEMYVIWAENIYNERIEKLKKIILQIITNSQSLIGEVELKIDNIESSYILKFNEWTINVEEERLKFHKSLQEVLKFHLECGPSFLLNLERQMRYDGMVSKSVAWDPPRMIGWKIITEGLKFTNLDVITFLKEIIPEFKNEIKKESFDEDTYINGSLFTDYIHYISKSDINFSPRTATKKLLEKLLRPLEIKKILQKYQAEDLKNYSQDQMIERLLIEFGWPLEQTSIKNKLADCIIEKEEKIIINEALSGNDIRIICENYCKDLADTLSSKIGYSAKELLDLVIARHPGFKTQKRGWNNEISELTIGSATFILDALLNEAFPDKREVSTNLISSLNKLREKFNKLSHDPPIGQTSELVDGLVELLQYAKELIFEMPWHFFPVQINGRQPIVLTGEAWSHSYKENRQLSIILWNVDFNNVENMLVWNPSKLNPVIPDGIPIIRPMD